ncbi:MAG: TolC family protein [Candidatus Sumerlaeota bacterium]
MKSKNTKRTAIYKRVGKGLIALCALSLLPSLSGCFIYPDENGSHPSLAAQVPERNLREIDQYRSMRPLTRDLDYAKSDITTYTTVNDEVTSAAIQFDDDIYRITLSDVLLTTLKNNRAIRVEDYNRAIAHSAIQQAYAIYDLLMTASAEYTNQDSQQPNRAVPGGGPVVSNTYNTTIQAALSQLLPSGARVSLYALQTRARTDSPEPLAIDPYSMVRAGVDFTQPLLRNFGRTVTEAPIRISRISEEISKEDFRDQVIEQLTTAVNSYWDLVFAVDNYEVQKLSLKRARELERVARIRFETGADVIAVVRQAEADVRRREALVIDARRSIADASDALKRIMNITEGSRQWEMNLVPVDRPSVEAVELNEEAIYDEALRFRPDFRGAALGLDILDIRRKVARNEMLPQLDATAGYSVSGLEDDFSAAVDEMETVDYDGYNIGLTLSFPLQNRRAREAYRQSEMELGQAREQIYALRDAIRLQVRRAIRGIRTSKELIAAWDAAVKAEQAKLDAQVRRYEYGMAIISDVLDFQEDLAAAQQQYLNAVINYNKALIELQRVKASFLSDYRIKVLEEPVTERLREESSEDGD